MFATAIKFITDKAFSRENVEKLKSAPNKF